MLVVFKTKDGLKRTFVSGPMGASIFINDSDGSAYRASQTDWLLLEPEERLARMRKEQELQPEDEDIDEQVMDALLDCIRFARVGIN